MGEGAADRPCGGGVAELAGKPGVCQRFAIGDFLAKGQHTAGERGQAIEQDRHIREINTGTCKVGHYSLLEMGQEVVVELWMRQVFEETVLEQGPVFVGQMGSQQKSVRKTPPQGPTGGPGDVPGGTYGGAGN